LQRSNGSFRLPLIPLDLVAHERFFTSKFPSFAASLAIKPMAGRACFDGDITD
jgi:hypothetical protein